jgi:hypothetical protein
VVWDRAPAGPFTAVRAEREGDEAKERWQREVLAKAWTALEACRVRIMVTDWTSLGLPY